MSETKTGTPSRKWKLYHSTIKEQQIVLSDGTIVPFVAGKFATNDPKVQKLMDKEVEDFPNCFIKEDEYEYEIDSPLDIESQKERMAMLKQLQLLGGRVVFDDAPSDVAAKLGVTTTALLEASGVSAQSNSGAGGTATQTSTGGVSAARAALDANKG